MSYLDTYDAANYLVDYLEPKLACKKFNKAVTVLNKSKLRFDTIVYTGLSGSLTGTVLAYLLKKHQIVIRKSASNSHSGRKIEGYKLSHNYIIVDDLIETGETVRKIKKHMKKFAPQETYQGTFTLDDMRLWKSEDD